MQTGYDSHRVTAYRNCLWNQVPTHLHTQTATHSDVRRGSRTVRLSTRRKTDERWRAARKQAQQPTQAAIRRRRLVRRASCQSSSTAHKRRVAHAVRNAQQECVAHTCVSEHATSSSRLHEGSTAADQQADEGPAGDEHKVQQQRRGRIPQSAHSTNAVHEHNEVQCD